MIMLYSRFCSISHCERSKQSPDTNASDCGARRRAGASLSHGRAQPSSGSDSQPHDDYRDRHRRACEWAR
eukprot:2504712-Pleurochrysis_carterae.AAC.1